MMNAKEFKTYFDERFLVLLEEKCKTFSKYSTNSAIPEIVFHIQSLAEQGKRFRPYMAYCGYTTEGGEQDIFPLFAAIELLHLFCLIHDDVIDDADTRRTMSTMNKKFGNNIAILAGDTVLAWAYECLDSVDAIEPYTIDDIRKQFAVLLTEVIHGQMLDVLHTDESSLSREAIEHTMMLKSAHYSFYHPLYIGMLLAGNDDEIKDFAEEYATNLGMAFQILDDITDCADDMYDKKQTLISWYMDNEKDANLAGALSFAEQIADEYIAAASDAIFEYNKNNESIWEDTIDEVQHAFM
jgi:geranylgeranyl pyrophosphate synthase